MISQPNIELTPEIAELYAKYRPNYPSQVIDIIENTCRIPDGSVIADVGCATGSFSKSLLDNGYKVIGIERSDAMREKATSLLSAYPNFTCLAGRAEATELPDNSVDCVTAATSFHWFNLEGTKKEFKRILKSGGWCFLVWNYRMAEASEFMQAYENLLLRYGVNYKAVSTKTTEEEIYYFFHPSPVKTIAFPNKQLVNLEGFQGRIMATAYAPRAGHPKHEPMMEVAKEIFHHYEEDGYVEFFYNARCYYGQMG